MRREGKLNSNFSKPILKFVDYSFGTHPFYLHAATFMYYYKKGEYKNALLESEKLDLPKLFRSSLLRIAVLGQLGKTEEIEAKIRQLKQLKPNFEKKAEYLISHFVKEDRLVELVMDGLRKSIMKV